jgi:hypothetical protein
MGCRWDEEGVEEGVEQELRLLSNYITTILSKTIKMIEKARPH